MPNATIRDVAREAAVSVASASRALNGHGNVRAETRTRVEQAAARLRYVPHAGARSLSMARAHAIGVVLPDLHGEFFSEIVRGMDREASRRGLQLLLSNMHADPQQAVQALRTMRGRVDGLVIMAPELDPALLLANLPRALPAVVIGRAGDGQHPALRIDNRAGAMAMVRHLIDGGRRRIVHVAGPRGNADADERAAGFREAMRRFAGVDDARVLPGNFLEEGGARAAAELLRDLAAVDAVFAGNDNMALGCLLAFREAGIDVPGRIALAGFDDVPLARHVTPALTTMQVRIADLGARAVTRLAEAMAGDGGDGHDEMLVPKLVIRASSGSSGETTIEQRQTGTRR